MSEAVLVIGDEILSGRTRDAARVDAAEAAVRELLRDFEGSPTARP